MKKITEILKEKSKEKELSLSVELVTPRNGEDTTKLFDFIQKLSGRIDFVSVTKGAGGSLRGGTLPITYFSQAKHGLNVVSHFVCRERNKQQIENELTDLYYFGIKNILALRGDAPVGAKDEAWTGDYKYAYRLVNQIKNMNQGLYLPTANMKVSQREGLPTDFCILVAGHPEDPLEEEVQHLRCKIEAGADAVITQMLFSFEDYQSYAEGLKAAGISLPVIAGIRPLISYSQAESIEKFFGIKVNSYLINKLKELENDEVEAREFGLDYAVEMIKKLKAYGCPGVHLFLLFDYSLLDGLLERI